MLAQKPWIDPIPGTTKLHRLEENLAATKIDLSTDDLAQMERVLAEVTVHGARYPQQLQDRLGKIENFMFDKPSLFYYHSRF